MLRAQPADSRRESALRTSHTPAPLRAKSADSGREIALRYASPRPSVGRPLVRGLAPRCASPRQSHGYGPSSVPDLASLPATPPPLESPSGRPHQHIVSAKGGGVRYSQRRIRPFANGEDSTFALRSKSGYGLGQTSRRAPASRTAFFRAVLRGFSAVLHGQAEIAAAFPPWC